MAQMDSQIAPIQQSVFIGGVHLDDVSSGKIKNLLSDIIQMENCHILKFKSETYGHIHFKTENDAGLFFQRVQGQTFEFEYNDDPGEIKTISMEFFRQKNPEAITILFIRFRIINHELTSQLGAPPVPQPPAPETSKALPIPGTSKAMMCTWKIASTLGSTFGRHKCTSLIESTTNTGNNDNSTTRPGIGSSNSDGISTVISSTGILTGISTNDYLRFKGVDYLLRDSFNSNIGEDEIMKFKNIPGYYFLQLNEERLTKSRLNWTRY
ncbi:10449_t:CDS:2 [Funneliformis mosseae]|uniref:10449_t:CDS:1 n=1 Tax=Funneliformis mosseae TaxID=27381 RepID=A0A9N9BJC6_FUNMO|nr:10449_t:CDS:2 [Funneliformis mosseae]